MFILKYLSILSPNNLKYYLNTDFLKHFCDSWWFFEAQTTHRSPITTKKTAPISWFSKFCTYFLVGGFSKILGKFYCFFVVWPNWFSEPPRTTYFDQKTMRGRQVFEKRSKKPFLCTFWKILTKKFRFFFRCALAFKIVVYTDAAGAFRTLFGLVSLKWLHNMKSKGDSLVGEGVESLRGRGEE